MDIGADRFAGGLDACRLLAHGEPADLDFDGVEAHLDVTFELRLQAFVPLALEVVAARCVGGNGIFVVAAEHAPERQAGGAGVAVPERDVEHRNPAHDHAGAPVQQRLLVHRGPEPLDAVWVLPDQDGREQLGHRLGDEPPVRSSPRSRTRSRANHPSSAP